MYLLPSKFHPDFVGEIILPLISLCLKFLLLVEQAFVLYKAGEWAWCTRALLELSGLIES